MKRPGSRDGVGGDGKNEDVIAGHSQRLATTNQLKRSCSLLQIRPLFQFLHARLGDKPVVPSSPGGGSAPVFLGHIVVVVVLIRVIDDS